MKVIRFRVDDRPEYGILEEDSDTVIGLKGDPLFNLIEPSGKIYQKDQIRMLSPIIPRSKIVATYNNYQGTKDASLKPNIPSFCIRPNTTVVGPDDPICIPDWATKVQAEVELGIVLKTLVKNVTPEQAKTLVAGFTVANDFSAINAVTEDNGDYSRSKCWDTSCPLGPVMLIDPEADLNNFHLECLVDGELKSSGTLGEYWFKPYELVSQLSQFMTLLPGDIILTGTIAVPAPPLVRSGQTVTTRIKEIGEFSNRIITEPKLSS